MWSRFTIDVYRELVKKVADLEARLAKEQDKRKQAEHIQKVGHEYHTVLLKKYRLLVSPLEFKLHLNEYDRSLKFELSEPRVERKGNKKELQKRREDELLENLKNIIDTSPERNQARVQDIDPQYKKRVEETHKKLQEKVGMKDSDKNQDKEYFYFVYYIQVKMVESNDNYMKDRI